MESILTSIKKLLGIEQEYDHFDADIIMHINTTFFSLMQLGVGPEKGFSITGANETWANFFMDKPVIEAVKTYMVLKVKLLFDPPTTSFVLDSYDKQIKELEWRLKVEVDPPIIVEGGSA